MRHQSTILFLLFGVFSVLCNAQELTITQIDSVLKKRLIDSQGKGGLKKIEVVGGGDLNRLNQPDGEDITAGNISLGFHFYRDFADGGTTWLEDIDLDFGLNVSSSVDSIVGSDISRFGGYLLQPINNRFSARLNFTSYLRDEVRYRIRKAKIDTEAVKEEIRKLRKNGAKSKTKKLQIALLKHEIREGEKRSLAVTDSLNSAQTPFNKLIEGVYFNLYGDVSDWTLIDGTTSQSTMVNTFQIQTGIFHELFSDQFAKDNSVSAKIGAGYSLRWLSGQIAQQENLLETFTDNEARFYHGIDFFASFTLDKLRAEVTVPWIFRRNDTDTPGLTGSNLLLSIRFIGGFNLLGLSRGNSQSGTASVPN